MKHTKLIIAALFLISPFAANATLINATNSGWYNSGGSANGTTGNTCVGCGGAQYRNWLGFDLSTITETITSATLSIFSDSRNTSGQTINWWDVSSNYGSLGSPSAAIYGDLGSGTLLATGSHTAGIYNNYSLNGAGLANLNSSIGSFWAIGGSSSNLSNAFGYNSGVGSSAAYYQLNIETSAAVPEPATFVLLGLGLAGLGWSRRKKA